MWLVFAAGSAFFAGLTSILAKCGIRKTDSTVATALRTIAVLIMAILMTMITGSWSDITNISGKTWLFLVLSGLATGGSWLCYFRALQVGDVNKVVPVDKSSTVLTMALAFIFLHESISPAEMHMHGDDTCRNPADDRKEENRQSRLKQREVASLRDSLGSIRRADLDTR